MPRISEEQAERIASRLQAREPDSSILNIVLQIAAEEWKIRRLQTEERARERRESSSERRRVSSRERHPREQGAHVGRPREQRHYRTSGQTHERSCSRCGRPPDRDASRSRGRRRSGSDDHITPSIKHDDRSLHVMSGGAGPPGTHIPERRRHKHRSSSLSVPRYKPMWGPTLGWYTYLTACVNYETECRAKMDRRQKRRERRDMRKKADARAARGDQPSSTVRSRHSSMRREAPQTITYSQTTHSQQVEARERVQASLARQHHSTPSQNSSRPDRRTSDRESFVYQPNDRAHTEPQEQASQVSGLTPRGAATSASTAREEENSNHASRNSNARSNSPSAQIQNTTQSQRYNVIPTSASPTYAMQPSTRRATPSARRSVQLQAPRSSARSPPQSQRGAPSARRHPTHILPGESRRGEQEIQAMTWTSPPTYRTLPGDDEDE